MNPASKNQLKQKMSSPFSVIVPGRPVISHWQQVDAAKGTVAIEFAHLVPDLTFFCTQPDSAFPPGYGALLYFSLTAPYTQWEVLGSISREKPSAIFSTGWGSGTRTEISEAMASGHATTVMLGIELVPLDVIANLEQEKGHSGFSDRMEFGGKVAKNLYDFMSSFGKPSGDSHVIVPVNFLERWIERFADKFRRDPNFLSKTA